MHIDEIEIIDVKNTPERTGIRGAIKNAFLIAAATAVVLGGSAYGLVRHMKYEAGMPQEWRTEIKEIKSLRERGFYDSADTKASYLQDEIRFYQNRDARGETLNQVSPHTISNILNEIDAALAAKSTNSFDY